MFGFIQSVQPYNVNKNNEIGQRNHYQIYTIWIFTQNKFIYNVSTKKKTQANKVYKNYKANLIDLKFVYG